MVIKFSTLFFQVSTLFGNNSGKALTVTIKKVNRKIEVIRINKIFLIGYPPTKHNAIIIENNMAVVEKLAGNINIKTANTGSHNEKIDFENHDAYP